MVNIARNILIILNNLLQMHQKLLQKSNSKKTSEATRDLIGNKMEQGQLQMKQKIQKILGL